jgi:serine/threonine protein kinase/tetratricopeptide (TPR) repeat protein
MPSELDRAAHQRALSLFERLTEQPQLRTDLTAGESPEVLAILSRLEAADRRARVSFPTADDAESVRRLLPLPERVGSYRLDELIGEGGMGLVFAGVRDDGLFDHRVAVKLIHPDRFSPAAITRFNRERRILAQLDHPNIARLIDGGVTDDGWPYIIMELIDGTTIDQHVADDPHNTDAIIGLLIGTAEALQAAHEALVIHGDIKPDNVLVHRDGKPRLLDFGVSRLADVDPPSELSGRTAAFCAPEVRLGESSTLRSDIYSFGRLMQSLLPKDRRVRPKNARLVDRTLGAIAAKATAADPVERYEYIGALLSDLRCWRTRFPVSVRRHDPLYVTGLFIRRHRLSSGIVAILLIAVAVAFASTLIAWRSTRAHIEDIRTLTHFQLVELDSRLKTLPHSIALRTRLAIEAQAYLSRLALDGGSPDELRREAADGFRRLALLQGAADRPSLGDPIAARVSFARALAVLTPKESPENRAMRASILIDAAKVASGDADPVRAARLLNQARPQVAGDENHARYLLTLSEVEQWNGHYARAIGVAEHARKLIAGLPNNPDAAAMHITAVDLAAEASFYAAQRTEALNLYRQALNLAMQAANRWPRDQRLRWLAERANWALGTTLLDAGDTAAASPLLERAYTSSRETVAADQADGVAQRRYRSFMLAYGQSLAGKRASEGIKLITRSQHLRQQWWQQAWSDQGRQRDWIVATVALGDALAKSRNATGACKAYKDARSLVERMRTERRLTVLDRDRLIKPFSQGRCKQS